ncbi:unnamed protein product [Soboliphyme baturini]|uniref:ACB domain-containing protein n=1 Tax=Soboliphyme baturini TaxID=241478 RepID=A0A183J9U9_9BILA|nr:unnamed protein product [Soboliphyme baturini]
MNSAAAPSADMSFPQDSASDSALQMLDNVSLRKIYLQALKFFKENDGKLCHPSYDQRVHLAALSKQVAYGRWTPSTNGVNNVGFFDRIAPYPLDDEFRRSHKNL